MKTLNETGFQPAAIPGRIGYPEHSMTLVVKGLFRLEEGRIREMLSDHELAFPTGDILRNEDDELGGECSYGSDFAFWKPRTDLCLVGHCHPPGPDVVASCRVTFQVGEHARSLQVRGDRWWAGEGLGRAATEPRPFEQMELSWSRAYGGPACPDNPVGQGYEPVTDEEGRPVWPLPNVEWPGEEVRAPEDRPTPAGFGPIPMGWEPRASLSGTYEDSWVATRWPWFPDDMDWSLFNTAPPRGQMEGFLAGNEALYLEHLVDGTPHFRTQLAGIRPRCFLSELPEGTDPPPGNRKDAASWAQPPLDEMAFREVPLQLDTLWVDADSELVALVWRGHVPVRDESFDEIHHLFVAHEDVEGPAMSLEEARAAFHELHAREEGDDTESAADVLASFMAADAEDEAAGAEGDSDVEGEADELDVDDDFEWGERLRADMEARGIDPDNPPEPTDEDRKEAARYFGEKGMDDIVAILEGRDPDKELEDEPDPAWTRDRVVETHARGDSMEDEDLRGLDLSELDLDGVRMDRANLTGADLSGTTLREARLPEARMDDAKLEGTILDAANLGKASLSRTRMKGASLVDADLTDASLQDARMEEADLSDATLDGANMESVLLERATLTGASLVSANLRKAILRHAVLDKADLSGAVLDGADAAHASMAQVEFTETRAVEANFDSCVMTGLRAADALDLSRSTFSRIDAEDSVWTGATLEGAVLAWSRLDGADFSKANLNEADFWASHLKGARFTEASLVGARLASCDAFEANLARADLARADLRGANFWAAELDEARFFETLWDGANFRMTKYG